MTSSALWNGFHPSSHSILDFQKKTLKFQGGSESGTCDISGAVVAAGVHSTFPWFCIFQRFVNFIKLIPAGFNISPLAGKVSVW